MYYLSSLSDYAFFTYISVRAGFAFFIALLLSLFFTSRFIRWAGARRVSQPIYELAPQTHQAKNHTPTMGGVIFISCAIVASLACVKFDNLYALASLLCLALFCGIGFLDDRCKVLASQNSCGLAPRSKLLAQLAAALLCVAPLYLSPEFSTQLYLPFYKYPVLDLGYFALIFWALVLISSSNAVNLTDGLDGLATVPSIFSIATLSCFVYLSGNLNYSEYLLLPKITGLGEVAIICAALIGALLGFLWFNCYPAQIFMGDSGSLALGGFIGLLAVLCKNEILLILIGAVFVIETVSVILQVGSFKIFNRRVFKMAPIHHHFEKAGWVENKIIVRFWMIALLANLLALASIKLR